MSKLFAALTPKTSTSQHWFNIGFVVLILAIVAFGFIADGYIDHPDKRFLSP